MKKDLVVKITGGQKRAETAAAALNKRCDALKDALETVNDGQIGDMNIGAQLTASQERHAEVVEKLKEASETLIKHHTEQVDHKNRCAAVQSVVNIARSQRSVGSQAGGERVWWRGRLMQLEGEKDGLKTAATLAEANIEDVAGGVNALREELESLAEKVTEVGIEETQIAGEVDSMFENMLGASEAQETAEKLAVMESRLKRLEK
jgi:chromosome segregation ATPase